MTIQGRVEQAFAAVEDNDMPHLLDAALSAMVEERPDFALAIAAIGIAHEMNQIRSAIDQLVFNRQGEVRAMWSEE